MYHDLVGSGHDFDLSNLKCSFLGRIIRHASCAACLDKRKATVLVLFSFFLKLRKILKKKIETYRSFGFILGLDG